MVCCIGIGKVQKTLWYLLLAASFRSLNHLIYGIRSYKDTEQIHIYASILKDRKLLQSIMKFFGIAVLSFAYNKMENQEVDNIVLNNNDNNLNVEEKSDKNISKNEKSKFLLIHNEIETEIDNTKYTTQILFIGFLLGFVELMDQFHYLAAPVNSDFWTFEILFTVIFIKKIFKTKLYKHQIFSMFFIVIFCSAIKTLLFLSTNKNLFNLNLLFIPGYILTTFIRSYVYTKIKWLMDMGYISNSKILFIYGLFGFFTSLIIYILTSIFPGYIGENFGNFSPVSNSVNWWQFIIEIILIIIYMCLNFFTKYYYMQILKIFSPIHVLIITMLYYLLNKIIRIIFLLLFNTKNIENYITDNVEKIVYSNLLNIFGFFAYLVFVEFIELKCCKYNYNIKKNIIRRSRLDSLGDIGEDEERNELDDPDRISNSSDSSD